MDRSAAVAIVFLTIHLGVPLIQSMWLSPGLPSGVPGRAVNCLPYALHVTEGLAGSGALTSSRRWVVGSRLVPVAERGRARPSDAERS